MFKDVAKHGLKVAIIDRVTGRVYTCNEVDESTAKYSSTLNRMGFKKNDVLYTKSCITEDGWFCSGDIGYFKLTQMDAFTLLTT